MEVFLSQKADQTTPVRTKHQPWLQFYNNSLTQFFFNSNLDNFYNFYGTTNKTFQQNKNMNVINLEPSI